MMHSVASIALIASVLVVHSGLLGCTSFTPMKLQHQLEQADLAFENRDYALAATLYESLRDRYPSSEQRQTMMIRQGQALYRLPSYRDAQSVFQNYLVEYPQGIHADDARRNLEKIAIFVSSGTPAEQEAIEAARQDLEQLNALRETHPHDPSVAFALGNLYYELGDYEQAVRLYFEAQTLDAAYKEKRLIKERMMIDSAGNPKPVARADIAQQELDRNPLVVFDSHLYHSGDAQSYRSAVKIQLNLTGKVRNQGSRVLHNVEIDVRFYNAQHQVLDVNRVHIGTLVPKEVRAFRAQTTTYDDLFNIFSFDYSTRWGR